MSTYSMLCMALGTRCPSSQMIDVLSSLLLLALVLPSPSSGFLSRMQHLPHALPVHSDFTRCGRSSVIV